MLPATEVPHYPFQEACYDRGVKVYLFLAKMVSIMTGLLNPKSSGEKKNNNNNNNSNRKAIFSFLCMILGHGFFSHGVLVVAVFVFLQNQFLGERC